MSCKCKKAHECEECPEWIFTFADLVMLMMGFFVILWVLKPAPGKDNPKPEDQDKFDLAIYGIREAFGYVPNPMKEDPLDRRVRMIRAGMRNAAENPQRHESPLGTSADTLNLRDGPESAIGGRLMFSVGSDELSAATRHALDQIADKIRGHRQIVVVKGFASLDDFPEGSTSQAFRDIAIKRARAVIDYLVEHHVEADILSLYTHGTYEPVRLHNYGAEGQSENRRVEVQVSSSLVEDRQGATPAVPKVSENLAKPE